MDRTTASQVWSASCFRRWNFKSLGGVISAVVLLASLWQVIRNGYDQFWSAYSASFGMISFRNLCSSQRPYHPPVLTYLPLVTGSSDEFTSHSYALMRYCESRLPILSFLFRMPLLSVMLFPIFRLSRRYANYPEYLPYLSTNHIAPEHENSGQYCLDIFQVIFYNPANMLHDNFHLLITRTNI